jgi:hypothetical protein
VAEVLVTFTEPTRAKNGDLYYGRAIGRQTKDGLWEGWVEFVLAGSDELVISPRETSQPNLTDLRYWAQGLSATYLEGALERALSPAPTPPVAEPRVFAESAPKPSPQQPVGAGRRVVLDPFLVYAEGEALLRNQLRALSRDHVQSIVEAYGFAGGHEQEWVRTASADALAERVVERVRARYSPSAPAAPAREPQPEA